MGRGLSCSRACGIIPDQGSNLCLLHWQADSQPRRTATEAPRQLMLDKRGQVVMSRETVEDGRMMGGRCARFGPGASFLLEQTGVPLMAWDPESRLQARDVKLCVAGMSHLFPSDGSEEKVGRGQRINSPGTWRPCFVALRGDVRASHVTPVAAAGARGTPELRSSPVCVLVCRVLIFFFFPPQMFTRVCLFFKAPGVPYGPTISPHDVGRGSVCV